MGIDHNEEHAICIICDNCVDCGACTCNAEMTRINEMGRRPYMVSTDPGRKFDKGKLRMDLLPPKAIRELAEVLTYGANKYDDNNWQGVETPRYIAALLRHVFAWMDGEELDPESGLHHLSHVLCNAAFLVHKEVPDGDQPPI